MVANDGGLLEAALAQLDPKFNSATTLAGEKVALANEKAQLEWAVGGATNGTRKHRELDEARAIRQRARIQGELGRALTEGRITAAEKPTWAMRLGNEAQFGNERRR